MFACAWNWTRKAGRSQALRTGLAARLAVYIGLDLGPDLVDQSALRQCSDDRQPKNEAREGDPQHLRCDEGRAGRRAARRANRRESWRHLVPKNGFKPVTRGLVGNGDTQECRKLAAGLARLI